METACSSRLSLFEPRSSGRAKERLGQVAAEAAPVLEQGQDGGAHCTCSHYAGRVIWTSKLRSSAPCGNTTLRNTVVMHAPSGLPSSATRSMVMPFARPPAPALISPDARHG